MPGYDNSLASVFFPVTGLVQHPDSLSSIRFNVLIP